MHIFTYLCSYIHIFIILQIDSSKYINAFTSNLPARLLGNPALVTIVTGYKSKPLAQVKQNIRDRIKIPPEHSTISGVISTIANMKLQEHDWRNDASTFAADS